MKFRRTLLRSSPLTLAALAGCTVGPDYKAPALDAPAAWTGAAAGGPGVATGAAPDLRQWWKSLHDPLLDSLEDRALAGNYDLRIAGSRIAQARALRSAAEAGSYPTLDAFSQYSRSRASSDLVTPGSGKNRAGDLYALGFDASWELDVWGAVRRAVESAEAGVAAAEEYRRDVMVALLAEVARNYIDLRTFQTRLAIARDNIKAQDDTLGLTQARFNAGLTSELDVTRATTNLETTRSQVPVYETGEALAAHRLGVLLGVPPGALLAELAPVKPIPGMGPEVPAGLPSDLLRRRPDIRRAERELASQHAQIGVAIADLYPRFTLNGSLSLQAGQIGNLFDATSRVYAAGPQVTWRFIDFGRIRANIASQEARTQEALEAYQNTVLLALEDAENALVSFSRQQLRLKSLQLAVDASKRSVQLAESLYGRGLTDFQNVLDAQRSLFVLQDQWAVTQGAVSTDLVAVYKALGGGWEDALPRSDSPMPGGVPSPWSFPTPVGQTKPPSDSPAPPAQPPAPGAEPMGLRSAHPTLQRSAMSKGQHFTPYQQGIVKRYYEHADSRLADKLGVLVSDLYLEKEPAKVAALWKQVHDTLKKTPVDQMRVGRIVAERKTEELAKLLGDVALGWEGAAPKPGSGAAAAGAPTNAPTPEAVLAHRNPGAALAGRVVGGPSLEVPSAETLKTALHAFKKRLKVTRLDDESKLGAKYVTGGKKSAIVAITPPNQFPRAVWDELVNQRKLKNAGSGLYQLVEGA